jgi:PIN domain-containing protein
MKFFFDNMMSPRLAKMLEAFVEGEHTVRHIRYDPRFRHNTSDAIRIPALADDDIQWSVISGDLWMLSSPTIIARLHKSRIVFFCMDKNWCSGNTENDQAWKLLRVWPDVVARARGAGPAFYEVRTAAMMPRIEELKFSRRARRRKLDL